MGVINCENVPTACKALIHANAKGRGIDSKGLVGNQVFRLAKEKRSEISGRDLQNTFWGIKNCKFHADN
jgi:hypothetical protein